jgi:hypothetical protein
MMLLALACACADPPSDDRQEIAALRLTCAPIPPGLHCVLLALFRNAARVPRDVTGDAIWRFDGPAGATISNSGIIQATQTGEVGITADYQSRRARAEAWLAPDARGEMLGTVRGFVYTEQRLVLQPVDHARVEVMSGSNVGRWTTTAADGSYTLSGLRPGQLRLRATELTHVTTEQAIDALVGENRQNLLMSPKTLPDHRGKALAKGFSI